MTGRKEGRETVIRNNLCEWGLPGVRGMGSAKAEASIHDVRVSSIDVNDYSTTCCWLRRLFVEHSPLHHLSAIPPCIC